MIAACACCHRTTTIEARGLCHRCYERARARRLHTGFNCREAKEMIVKVRRKGVRASEHVIKIVWRTIVDNPGASYREIAAIAGIGNFSSVGYAVRELARRGAITRASGVTSRTVRNCAAVVNGEPYAAVWLDL